MVKQLKQNTVTGEVVTLDEWNNNPVGELEDFFSWQDVQVYSNEYIEAARTIYNRLVENGKVEAEIFGVWFSEFVKLEG